MVGRIGRRYWSGMVTCREGRLRIISVRLGRDEKIAIYEDQGERTGREVRRGRKRHALFRGHEGTTARHEQRRVNVDFPVWMIESLDREASRRGVPRQSLIKVLIARHLEEASREAS